MERGPRGLSRSQGSRRKPVACAKALGRQAHASRRPLSGIPPVAAATGGNPEVCQGVARATPLAPKTAHPADTADTARTAARCRVMSRLRLRSDPAIPPTPPRSTRPQRAGNRGVADAGCASATACAPCEADGVRDSPHAIDSGRRWALLCKCCRYNGPPTSPASASAPLSPPRAVSKLFRPNHVDTSAYVNHSTPARS